MKVKKGQKLAELAPKEAIIAKIDGKLYDLSKVLDKDSEVEFIDINSDKGIDTLRHSSAHILADAVVRLFPDAKPTIGPVVEEGFYYDFDYDKAFTPEDLKKIEKEMRKIIAEKIAFEREEVSLKEAKKMFGDNRFKIEMIEEFGENLTVYRHGKFVDLCRGPHIPNTGFVKGFKLLKVAGAYWRADVKNAQLQRIYGISFPSEKQLKEYVALVNEAEKRDHRKLGKRLDLFSIHEEAPGSPFFLPKGMFLINKMIEVWREEHDKDGYVEIKTPVILHKKLWEQSGHWVNYRENMYTLKIDEQDFAVKPMNCPGGMLVYKEKAHSYKELPLRVGELGLVHRHELSGVLAGLFRVRVFTQDDAHIYMTDKQIKDEIIGVINLTERLYKIYDFDYDIELSTRPEKSIGSAEHWEFTTAQLKAALDELGKDYKINEGDGAFYGPKIDFHLKDAIGRRWQCGTIQLDMSLPERFDLTYMGQDGNADHRPFMIHRALYGSLERFLGILIEHYAGKFPMWLSPEQVRILTVSEKLEPYAAKLEKQFRDAGLRVTVDKKGDSISKKVRNAQLSYVNYILIVGEKEEQNKTVNVRTRDNEILGEKKPADMIKQMVKEEESRK